MVYGKGGPYGSRTKRRVIPLSTRVQPLLEGHSALHETLIIKKRMIQYLVKQVAGRAAIARPVTPMCFGIPSVSARFRKASPCLRCNASWATTV